MISLDNFIISNFSKERLVEESYKDYYFVWNNVHNEFFFLLHELFVFTEKPPNYDSYKFLTWSDKSPSSAQPPD